MLAFFSKLFLFQVKISKMRFLHCDVKFQQRKLGCALTWYENGVLFQLNQKVHCEVALRFRKKLICAALLI